MKIENNIKITQLQSNSVTSVSDLDPALKKNPQKSKASKILSFPLRFQLTLISFFSKLKINSKNK
jgi:hypothetical protein